MKIYKLNSGKWVTERPLTVKEKKQKSKKIKEFLISQKTSLESDSFDEIKKEMEFEDVTKLEYDQLNIIWEEHKPKEKEHKIIDASIIKDGSGKERGIINYRDQIGNHKQIRF